MYSCTINSKITKFLIKSALEEEPNQNIGAKDFKKWLKNCRTKTRDIELLSMLARVFNS